MEKLNDDIADSISSVKADQARDREMLGRAVEEARAEFQDNLDGVKNDIVTEIKDNIAVLGDNISSLEDAIHDDVNKLKNMMCDLGENMEEEKLLRNEEEKKIRDALSKSVGDISDKLKVANDAVEAQIKAVNEEMNTNKDLIDTKINVLGQDMDDKIKNVEQVLTGNMDTKMRNIETDLENLKLSVNDDMDKINESIHETENKLLERLYDEEDKRIKDAENFKNALEEEKLLKGQEIEVMKKTIADANQNMTDLVTGQMKEINKIIEEEKDERAGQNDDMITRLDRERKERMKVNDMIQNQLHDAVDNIVAKQMQDVESIREALDREAENQQQIRLDINS